MLRGRELQGMRIGTPKLREAKRNLQLGKERKFLLNDYEEVV
jgi:hypothetical protein